MNDNLGGAIGQAEIAEAEGGRVNGTVSLCEGVIGPVNVRIAERIPKRGADGTALWPRL